VSSGKGKNPAGRCTVRGNAERATNRGVGEPGSGQPGMPDDRNASGRAGWITPITFPVNTAVAGHLPLPRYLGDDFKEKRVPVLSRSNVSAGLRQSWEIEPGYVSDGEGVSLPPYRGRRCDSLLTLRRRMNRFLRVREGDKCWGNPEEMVKSKYHWLALCKLTFLCPDLLKMLVHSSSFRLEVWGWIWTYCPRTVHTELVRLETLCICDAS